MDVSTKQTPILEESCALRTPACILLSDRTQEILVRFSECSPDGETILFVVQSLGELSSIDQIRLGQHCVVTFGHEQRARLFLTVIKEYGRDGDRMVIEVPAPPRVTTAELRGALRVPTLGSELAVELMVEDDELHRPRVRNLSATGMLVEFDAETDPGLRPFDKVATAVRLGEERAVLRGIVRRCEPTAGGTIYGLLFPETTGGVVPESLRRIVDQIEREWLESQRS